MTLDGRDLRTFFSVWAKQQPRWTTTPGCHWRALEFLENRGELAVFMAFRGFSKSTLLGAYNAWRYWRDPTYRILHQGADDPTAFKTSRDTKSVLQRHPWIRMKDSAFRGEIKFWSVSGNPDERNPSMQAAGILSNVTSSRADEVQNDDVEVPKNIQNHEAREKLRYRLGEQVHILVPGGKKLFVGTPHTHDSLYEEHIANGADVLKIPLFEQEQRFDTSGVREFPCAFEPETVFIGIGKGAKVSTDHTYRKGILSFKTPPNAVIDAYAGNAWPERFTEKEMAKRRRECRTLNEWDSQYQLHARPIHEIRLDPDALIPYDLEPEVVLRNRQVSMWLGNARIMSASLQMDPSSGKLRSDVCALALMLQDEPGNLYWHKALALTGELAVFDDAGSRIIGGQVMQICDVVEKYQLPGISVENNGVGAHVGGVLRAALKSRGLICAVVEKPTVKNKAASILGALEPPLKSGTMWAHVDVIDTVKSQMREWNPAATNQPDDYLDAAAKAIEAEPVRIGKIVVQKDGRRDDWRPAGGVHEYGVAA